MDDISAADANEEEGKQGGANANLGAQIATPQVSSKHWRKIRTAVVALAAFRSKRVSWRRSLALHLFVLDVAMVWNRKPASVTTGSRDRTYVRK